MKELKLTIDLLPRGAWGNNLSKRLAKKDWDILRELCYKRHNYICAGCGKSNVQLEAHEVWNFDIPRATQTLQDITALCVACHGVKHFRNSQRTGYGDYAKEHFLKINKCDSMEFAYHLTRAEQLFEERNQIYRWTIIADLKKFGGYGIELKERHIPFIENPYENTDLRDWRINSNIFTIQPSDKKETVLPQVRLIIVDNYSGTITVVSDNANKIEWFLDDKLYKIKYNVVGRFYAKLSVENLKGEHIRFVLCGNGGQVSSHGFGLALRLR